MFSPAQGIPLQTGFQLGMEYILGIDSDVTERDKLARDQAEPKSDRDILLADDLEELENRDALRDRYVRTYWEPVVEGEVSLVLFFSGIMTYPFSFAGTHRSRLISQIHFHSSETRRGSSRPAQRQTHDASSEECWQDEKCKRSRANHCRSWQSSSGLYRHWCQIHGR